MSARARSRDPLRSTAALAAGRAAAGLSQALGRGSGTMIGGRLALRLDPDVLATVAGGRRPVVVTGTNGKSTVTALAAAALSAGGPVVTNSTGANMPDGIVTALTADRTSPLAVLEVDEVYVRAVVDATAPRVVIALNAFREYTRGVSLAATLAHWREAAARLPEDCVVLVNVDDPARGLGVRAGTARRRGGRGPGLARGRRPVPSLRSRPRLDRSDVVLPGVREDASASPRGRSSGRQVGGWSIAHPNGTVEVQVSVPGRTGPVGAAFALAAAHGRRHRRRSRRGGPEQRGRRGWPVRAVRDRGPSRTPADAEEPRRMGRGHRRRGLRGAAARDRRRPVRTQGHHHHVGGTVRTPGRSRCAGHRRSVAGRAGRPGRRRGGGGRGT